MLSQVLKALRKQKKVSQAELAEVLGITQQAVARWERNKSEPDTETLRQLSKYFNVSIDYLLGNENQKNFPPLNDEEIKLVCGYRVLDKNKKQTVLNMLEFFISAQTPPGNLSIQNNNGNGNFFANNGNNYVMS